MSTPPNSTRKAFIEQMFEALETPHKDLTKWEENFVASVRDQFERRGTLTDAQVEVLDRIYTEKTP